MANIFSWNADAFSDSNYEVKANTSIDSSVFHGGTGSMKIASSVTPEAGDQGYKNLNGSAWGMSFGGVYYHRWWMKMDSGLTYSNQNKLKACRWKRGADVVDFMTGYLLKSGVQPGEHGGFGFTSDQGPGTGGEGPAIAYNFDPATNSDVQNWQEYIVRFAIHSSAGTADGKMTFYVNGTNIGSLTGVLWFTGADTSLQEIWAPFMQMNFPQDVSGNLWIDDVSVDTTWNSTTYSDPDGGGGSGGGDAGAQSHPKAARRMIGLTRAR